MESNNSFVIQGSYVPLVLLPEAENLSNIFENDISFSYTRNENGSWVKESFSPILPMNFPIDGFSSQNELTLGSLVNQTSANASSPNIITHGSSERLTSIRHIIPSSRSISIFTRKDLEEEIDPSSTLNKDLIYYFKLPEVFTSGSDQFGISLDASVKVKWKKSGQEETDAVLSAKLLNLNNIAMTPCPTCAQKHPQIIGIREVIPRERDLVVSASIGCSGNPSDSVRLLKLQFHIVRGGSLIWHGFSSIFRLYHHRGKLSVQNTSSSPNELEKDNKKRIMSTSRSNFAKHHKLLQSADLPSFFVDEHPLVREIYPHLLDILHADKGSHLTEPIVHVTFRTCSYYFNTHEEMKNRSFAVKFVEFLLSMIAIGGGAISQEESENFVVFHIAKVQERVAELLKESHVSWSKLWSSHDDQVKQADQWKKYCCSCPECYYSHLTCIVRNARNAGYSKSQIANTLNDMKIPSRQGKMWHTSLNGLLKKPGFLQPNNDDFGLKFDKETDKLHAERLASYQALGIESMRYRMSLIIEITKMMNPDAPPETPGASH